VVVCVGGRGGGAEPPPGRGGRARFPWEICFFAFTTFTEGEKKDGKRGENEGKLTVAMLDKNRVKILDNIEIVKKCPKYLR